MSKGIDQITDIRPIEGYSREVLGRGGGELELEGGGTLHLDSLHLFNEGLCIIELNDHPQLSFPARLSKIEGNNVYYLRDFPRGRIFGIAALSDQSLL